MIKTAGTALVAVLESHGSPCKRIELNSKDITIEDEVFTLEREISLDNNEITETSKSITIDDNGEIEKNSSHSVFSRSKSFVSLHGIEVPTTLFPDFWERKNNQVHLSWPFPLILIVDICGHRDLDLNSARTEIIISEKWVDFEEELAFLICGGIAKAVGLKYWSELKSILSEHAKSDSFIRGLNKVK